MNGLSPPGRCRFVYRNLRLKWINRRMARRRARSAASHTRPTLEGGRRCTAAPTAGKVLVVGHPNRQVQIWVLSIFPSLAELREDGQQSSGVRARGSFHNFPLWTKPKSIIGRPSPKAWRSRATLRAGSTSALALLLMASQIQCRMFQNLWEGVQRHGRRNSDAGQSRRSSKTQAQQAPGSSRLRQEWDATRKASRPNRFRRT